MNFEQFVQRLQDASTPAGLTFIATRYPFTYAYDFVRSHPEVIDVREAASRSDAAGLVRLFTAANDLDHETVVNALADAYLAEHRIVKPLL